MRISDIVKQIRAVIPNHTDYFGDTHAIASIVAIGGVASVTTSAAHSLSSGDVVSLTGVMSQTPIDSVTQDGLNFTFTTSIDHDLTFGWTDHESIKLSGFDDAQWNTAFILKSSDNRKTFKVMSSNTLPVLNGNEVLLEDRIDGINGVYAVTVIGSYSFSINGDFNDGTYYFSDGKVSTNIRCASTIDIDRAIAEYTRQKTNDFWLFVEPQNAEVSKDRSTLSDAVATRVSGDDIRMRLIDGFTVYIVAPSSSNIAGENVVDICRHDLMLPIFKSVLGVKFDTGLSCEGDFKTIATGHRVAAYDKAYMVYAYEFQVVMDITNNDAVDPSQTRAFRDIDYTHSIGGDDTTDMTALINLDNNSL